MLVSLLRRSFAFSPALHSSRRVCLLPAHRSVSTTSTRRSALTPEPPTPEEEAELEAASATSPLDPENDLEEDVAGDGSRGLSYKRFLSTIGAQYKYAQPNNWLGGDVVCSRGTFLCYTRSEALFSAFPDEP